MDGHSMTQLGKYELLSSLGSGATAEVYQARDTVLGREVALKILKPALVADPGAFERFIREAQAAAGLFHPNIATVLDMGEAEGRYFIAMRYIPGQSLDKVLKEKGPLSWEQALQMLQQVGSALDFAHKKGLLHRDVKPSNIICSPEGEYVLTDFGLQKAMAASNLTSHTGAVLGTPAYIAPEIWNGQPTSPASDVYSLACVFCETLTGKVLFDGQTTQEIITKHLIRGPQLPGIWPERTPESIGKMLGKALAMLPQERYQSMREAVSDLEANISQNVKSPQAVVKPPLVDLHREPVIVPGTKKPEGESGRFIPEKESPSVQGTEPPQAQDQNNEAVRRFAGSFWKPVLWITLAWAIGWLVFGGISIAIRYTGILGLSVLILVGGSGTGMVLKNYLPSGRRKLVFWLILSWVIGDAILVIFLCIQDTQAFIIIAFPIALAIGGLGTGLVLRKKVPRSSWKFLLWLSLGWAISIVISGALLLLLLLNISFEQTSSNVYILIILSVIGAINGLIGGSITIWQLRKAEKQNDRS
jgi:serine/threonine protein kinase